MQFSPSPPRPPILHSHTHTTDKADSTLRSSQAVPHPSTNRALCRLTSEVRRDPVHSTWYGRRQVGTGPETTAHMHPLFRQLVPGFGLSAVQAEAAESHTGRWHLASVALHCLCSCLPESGLARVSYQLGRCSCLPESGLARVSYQLGRCSCLPESGLARVSYQLGRGRGGGG